MLCNEVGSILQPLMCEVNGLTTRPSGIGNGEEIVCLYSCSIVKAAIVAARPPATIRLPHQVVHLDELRLSSGQAVWGQAARGGEDGAACRLY